MHNLTSSAIIDLFLAHQQARSFSECTIRRRRHSLTSLARWAAPMGLLDLDTSIVEEWVGSLNAARTRHAYQSDANAFYSWAIKRKLTTTNPAGELDPIRIPKGLPRPVPAHALRLIVGSAPDRHLRVGLALAGFAGLRRSEVVHLETSDLAFAARPAMLMVRNGKWGKDREVPMHPELIVHLSRRQVQGRVVPMTPDAFGRRAAQHIRSCGFDYTVHSLRSTFATELSRVSRGNVALVGKLLGHEDPATTMDYIGLAGFVGMEQVGEMYGDDAA